jgi:hypothetical protein
VNRSVLATVPTRYEGPTLLDDDKVVETSTAAIGAMLEARREAGKRRIKTAGVADRRRSYGTRGSRRLGVVAYGQVSDAATTLPDDHAGDDDRRTILIKAVRRFDPADVSGAKVSDALIDGRLPSAAWRTRMRPW